MADETKNNTLKDDQKKTAVDVTAPKKTITEEMWQNTVNAIHAEKIAHSHLADLPMLPSSP